MAIPINSTSLITTLIDLYRSDRAFLNHCYAEGCWTEVYIGRLLSQWLKMAFETDACSGKERFRSMTF